MTVSEAKSWQMPTPDYPSGQWDWHMQEDVRCMTRATITGMWNFHDDDDVDTKVDRGKAAWVLFALASVFFSIGGMMGVAGASAALMIPSAPLYLAAFILAMTNLENW